MNIVLKPRAQPRNKARTDRRRGKPRDFRYIRLCLGTHQAELFLFLQRVLPGESGGAGLRDGGWFRWTAGNPWSEAAGQLEIHGLERLYTQKTGAETASAPNASIGINPLADEEVR